MSEFNHEPVLLRECIEMLSIKSDGVYIDGTLGGAGHSSYILQHLGENGILIGLDQDEDAIKVAAERLQQIKDAGKSKAEYIFQHINIFFMNADNHRTNPFKRKIQFLCHIFHHLIALNI